MKCLALLLNLLNTGIVWLCEPEIGFTAELYFFPFRVDKEEVLFLSFQHFDKLNIWTFNMEKGFFFHLDFWALNPKLPEPIPREDKYHDSVNPASQYLTFGITITQLSFDIALIDSIDVKLGGHGYHQHIPATPYKHNVGGRYVVAHPLETLLFGVAMSVGRVVPVNVDSLGVEDTVQHIRYFYDSGARQ